MYFIISYDKKSTVDLFRLLSFALARGSYSEAILHCIWLIIYCGKLQTANLLTSRLNSSSVTLFGFFICTIHVDHLKTIYRNLSENISPINSLVLAFINKPLSRSPR